MRMKLLALLFSIFSFYISAKANYQALELGAANQPVQKKVLYNSRSGPATPFKLGVQDTTSTFEPSNIGIIGVKYLHRQGEMSTIIAVYPHTPASAAGIMVGDRLLAVDGANIMNFTADQVYAVIAGRPEESVDLKLMRCPGGGSYGCQTYYRTLKRMDMNEIASDNVFKVYRYGN